MFCAAGSAIYRSTSSFTCSWQSQMTVVTLTLHRMLKPYADVVLLLGPMLHEEVRTDQAGRPVLVADALARWATSSSLSGFASAHQRLSLLVSEAPKEHVLPIELSACITAFPAMLHGLNARLAWSQGERPLEVQSHAFHF